MSEAHVTTVKGMYEAFGKGDIPTVLAALDPKIEWWEAENFIYADQNPYVGPEGVLTGVFMRIAQDWDNFVVTPDAVLDAGDIAVGHGYYSGVYKKTGTAVKAQFAHMFTFRDGKVIKFQQYTDTAQFQRAVGEAARAA